MFHNLAVSVGGVYMENSPIIAYSLSVSALVCVVRKSLCNKRTNGETGQILLSGISYLWVLRFYECGKFVVQVFLIIHNLCYFGGVFHNLTSVRGVYMENSPMDCLASARRCP